jgi:hypothetical protein
MHTLWNIGAFYGLHTEVNAYPTVAHLGFAHRNTNIAMKQKLLFFLTFLGLESMQQHLIISCMIILIMIIILIVVVLKTLKEK